MTDIVERLRGYNPPDRTVDEQRQMAVDIHDAADEIERLRAALKKINVGEGWAAQIARAALEASK